MHARPARSRKILRVLDEVDEVDVAQHLQVQELGDDAGHPKRRDGRVVCVQLREKLEAAVRWDDLPLNVLLHEFRV